MTRRLHPLCTDLLSERHRAPVFERRMEDLVLHTALAIVGYLKPHKPDHITITSAPGMDGPNIAAGCLGWPPGFLGGLSRGRPGPRRSSSGVANSYGVCNYAAMLDARRKRSAVDEVGFWWHSIDLGDGIVTPGRKTPEILADELVGIALPDLTGKSVLDIGGWDGFFAFEAERRGAARVAVLDKQVWSVDFAGTHAYWRECKAAGVEPDPQEEQKFIDPVGLPGKAGFDLAHRALNSNVETIVADFENDDLDRFGKWDVILFLGVLYHLRNPFDALTRLRSMTGELAIIETHAHTFSDEDAPLWQFYPGAELNNDVSNWWVPNMAGLQATLAAAEFGTVDVKRAAPDPATRDYRAIVHAR